MYAIVEIAGQQYKVEKDQQVFVHRLEGKEGSKVSFDNVLLTADGDTIEVGAPAVKGISVSAKIVEHLKGDKVIVFKKKRRKGYKVRNGHRQYLSKIQIEGIGKSSAKSSTAKAETKTADKPKAEAKPKEAVATKKEASKAAPKAEKKTTATKKEPAKTAVSKEAKDDLTQIKGIGPVHAKELNNAGFTSFDQIASLTAKDIEKITAIEGIGAEMIESEEWKEQATVQNNFKKLLVSLGTAKAAQKDNLTEINGIGEVLEKEMNEVGVYTYEQISKILVKDMEYLSALTGVTRNKIESEEWVKQAKALLKK